MGQPISSALRTVCFLTALKISSLVGRSISALLLTTHKTPEGLSGIANVDKSTKPMPSYVAVNTTAGTASEMTRYCILTDTSRKEKMAIVDTITVNAQKDACGMTNPRTLKDDDVKTIY